MIPLRTQIAQGSQAERDFALVINISSYWFGFQRYSAMMFRLTPIDAIQSDDASSWIFRFPSNTHAQFSRQ